MKIKSFLSVLMALMLMIGCISGCGNNETDSIGSSSEEKEINENAEVFTIAKTAYYSDEDSWNGDDEYGEAIRGAIAEIESECNIKIEIDYYSPTEFVNVAQSAITNGDTEFADIMIHPLFTFGPIYAQGLLYDLRGIEGLNIESEYWNDAIKDVSSFKNGIYGIGSSGINEYRGGVSVLYNRDMVKSLGLEDPVEIVRRGEWTWDKLREYSLKAAKDLNNDGQFTDADRYGCTSDAYDGFCPVWLTAGVPTIVKDKDGNLTYNMLSDEAVTVLQKFYSVFTIKDGMFFTANMSGLVQQQQFLSGKTLFLLGGISKENKDSEGDFEIAVLPLPKYTVDSEYVTPVFHNTSIISVPANTEREELIGKVLTLLGEKTKDFGKYNIEDASVNYVDRDQFIEMSEKYGKNISVDPFNLMLNVNESISIGTMRAIGGAAFGSTYSTNTESQAKKIQSLLDEMFNQD